MPRPPPFDHRASRRPPSAAWRRLRALSLAAVVGPLGGLGAPAGAAEPPVTLELDAITVTATRLDTPLARTPGAANVVDAAPSRQAGQRLGLGEPLRGIPGLFLQNRHNFAQDLRIAIRGFGARSTFGIRGIRILVDGIPATLPDGQSGVDGIDPGSLGHVEVIRGPASSLYGPAAGGVISLFTEEGPATPFLSGRLAAGSHGFAAAALKAGGQHGPLNYLGNVSHVELDGFREHARAETNLVNAKVRYALDDASELSVVLNAVDAPVAEDPGGLTRVQVKQDRGQAHPRNRLFDAGESVRQQRVGWVYWRGLGEHHELRIRNYAVWRDFTNKLPFAGDVASGNGGQVAFDRLFVGGGVQYTATAPVLGRANRFTLGLDVDHQHDDRRRFVNDLGRRGPRTLDQSERVTSYGVFAQDELQLPGSLALTGGIRYDRVEFDVEDRFLANATGDDSGQITFAAWSPRLALQWSPHPAASLYASLSTAFETPTTTELARPAGGGFDPSLEPQTATSYELGARGEVAGRLRYSLAAFRMTLADELVPFEVAGQPGRSFFRNAGESSRRGLEAALELRPTSELGLSLAYTHSRFEFERFAKTELVGGTRVLDGNRLPGVPRHEVHARIDYAAPGGLDLTFDVQLVDERFADDENTVRASGYVVSNLRLAYAREAGAWTLTPFLGVDNLLDADYDDNLRINAAAGRFFEPAPGRNVYGGVTLRLEL